MNKRIAFVIPIAALYLWVVWALDPFLVFGLNILALYCVVPIISILLGFLLNSAIKQRSLRTPLVNLGIVATFALIVGSTIPINRFVYNRAEISAKAYPARISESLEAYKRAHGVYPQRLDRLPSPPSVPRLLRRSGYRSDGKTYSFSFAQPGGPMNYWYYESSTGEWRLAT